MLAILLPPTHSNHSFVSPTELVSLVEPSMKTMRENRVQPQQIESIPDATVIFQSLHPGYEKPMETAIRQVAKIAENSNMDY